MASHALLPGFVFHQELCMCKVSQPYLLGCGAGKELIRPRTLSLGPQHCKESWNPMSPLLLNNHNVKSHPAVKRPMLINMKDAHSDSVLFSFGIAEHCARHEKILQFLMSGSREGEKGVVLDASLLSDLLGLQNLTTNLHQFAGLEFGFYHHGLGTGPSLCYPPYEFCAQAQTHVWDFDGDLACRSKINIDPVGQILYTGSSIKTKDPIVVEFCLLKNSTMQIKQRLLVPQFSRLDSCKALSASKTLGATKVAPLKSFEKVKLKPSQKKNSRKAGQERDLYGNNYFHACESLLSLMMDTRLRGEKMTFVSLKKSGPELPQLLTQFSAGIAGAGLVAIFSSVCKVACGRVPFCTTKLFNTWVGFGLVWLSGAVNNLRDTIVQIGKSSRKLSLKEDEMMKKVDQRVSEIFFRAVVVMAVAALRFA